MREAPTLDDYCIKTGMIAQYWNDHKDHYPNKKGATWTAVNVGTKISSILEKIDSRINSGGVLKKLYKSGNGENNSHYIFFDATESAIYNQKLKNASLAEYDNIVKDAVFPFTEYKENTYNTLWSVFKMWDSVRLGEDFKSTEMEEFRCKMEMLIPYTKDIEEIISVLSRESIESKEVEEAFDKLDKEFEERKRLLSECLVRFYVVTRTEEFYENRIYKEKQCTYNNYYMLHLEWSDKWKFVIENAVSIYSEIAKKGVDISDVVEVLLIWYQYKKMKDGIKVEDLRKQGESIKEYCKKIFKKFIEMEGFQEGEIPEKIRSFLIISACYELENIAEIDESTIKSIKKEKRKIQPPELEKMIFSILECINVINPRKYRINTLEMAENEIAEEVSD